MNEMTFVEAVVTTLSDKILYLNFEVCSFYSPVKGFHLGAEGQLHVEITAPERFREVTCIPVSTLIAGAAENAVHLISQEEFRECPYPLGIELSPDRPRFPFE